MKFHHYVGCCMNSYVYKRSGLLLRNWAPHGTAILDRFLPTKSRIRLFRDVFHTFAWRILYFCNACRPRLWRHGYRLLQNGSAHGRVSRQLDVQLQETKSSETMLSFFVFSLLPPPQPPPHTHTHHHPRKTSHTPLIFFLFSFCNSILYRQCPWCIFGSVPLLNNVTVWLFVLQLKRSGASPTVRAAMSLSNVSGCS